MDLPFETNRWNELKQKGSGRAVKSNQILEAMIDQVKRIFSDRKYQGKIELVDVKVISTSDSIIQWQEQFGDFRYHPLLTFHGTSERNFNSIIENGYIMPGELRPGSEMIEDWWSGTRVGFESIDRVYNHQPEDGKSPYQLKLTKKEEIPYLHRPSNGSWLGEGIYTTTDPLVSQWYSDLDRNGVRHMLVNLVQVDRVQHPRSEGIIKSCDGYFPINAPKSKWENVLGYNVKDGKFWNDNWDLFAEKKVDGNIPARLIRSLKRQEVAKFFAETDHDDLYLVDTNMSNDRTVLVSASSEYVKPVLLLTLQYRKEKFNLSPFRSLYRFWDKSYANLQRIKMYWFAKDWYFIDRELIKADNHILVRRDGQMTQIFCDRIRDFIGSLGGPCRLYIYDKDGIKVDRKIRNFESVTLELLRSLDMKTDPGWDAHEDPIEFKDAPVRALGRVISRIEVGGHLYWINPENGWVDGLKAKRKYRLPADLGYQALKIHLRVVTGTVKYDYDRVIPNRSYKAVNAIHKLRIVPHQVKVKITYPYGIVGSGFVERLHQVPVWDSVQPYLFKGVPPEYMWVDDQLCQILLKKLGDDVIEEEERIRDWKEMLRLAKEDKWKGNLDWDNLKKMKKIEKTEKHLSRFDREEKIKTRPERLTPEEEEEARKARIVEQMNGEALIRLVNDFKTFAFGSVDKYRYYLPVLQELIEPIMGESALYSPGRRIEYLLLSTLNEMTILNKVAWQESKWFQKLLNMRYRKNIVKRSLKFKQIEDGQSIELNLSGIRGYPLEVIRSDSSMVDPWLTIIRLDDEASLASVTAEESLVLPEQMDLSDPQMVAYLSFLFTDTPNCPIKGQDAALLAVTWCQSPEENRWGMMNRVIDRFRGWSLPEGITEKDDVTSICKLLALMKSHPRDEWDGKYDYFGILAECIMRGARVGFRLRRSKLSLDQFLRKFLVLEQGSKVRIDIGRSSGRLWKYFRNWWMTNLNPYDCVKVLGWIDGVNYSMRDFLNKFLPQYGKEGSIVMNGDRPVESDEMGSFITLALWVHGARYHKARDRVEFVEFDPNVLNVIVSELNQKDEMARLRAERIARTQSLRRQHFMEAADKYREYHQEIRLFTVSEVHQHNITCKKGDEWYLCPGGTLMYRCCYVDCPEYLKKQKSEHQSRVMYDGKYQMMMSRNRLFRHLKYNRAIHRYHSAFHLYCKQTINGIKSRSDFCHQIYQHFKNDLGAQEEEIVRYAGDYWDWKKK